MEVTQEATEAEDAAEVFEEAGVAVEQNEDVGEERILSYITQATI